MEDAILSAPRKWLFNALEEAAVEEMRVDAERRAAQDRQREERRRQREEAKQKATVDRLVAAFRRMTSTKQRETDRGRAHLARVRDAGLAEHVGVEIAGGVCFAVPNQEWEAAIIDGFVIGKEAWHVRTFMADSVVEFLRVRGFVLPDFPVAVSETLGAAARAVVPNFRTPSEAVEAYLGLLGRRFVLRREERHWYRDRSISQQASERISQAIEGRRRTAELAEKIRTMLAVIPQGDCIDVESWMGATHRSLSDTPLSIAMAGGWEHAKLVGHLDRLEAMLEPGAAVEENLLMLPLEMQLEARREEHRVAEERRARHEAEAALKAAEEERRKAERRKKMLTDYATAWLGDKDGAAWLARQSSLLGDIPIAALQGLTEGQYEATWRGLMAEKSHRVAKAEREATIRTLQETLRAEAKGYGDSDWVNFWMGARNDLLDKTRPVEVCVDQPGLKRCQAALRQGARRLRMA
jgi:hypothetical protein